MSYNILEKNIFINRTIIDQSWIDNNKLILTLDNNYKIHLIAEGECCSFSYFKEENKPFEYLKNKTIIDFVEDKNFCYKSKTDYGCFNYCKKKHKYIFKLKDNEDFIFYLYNESNGYYDGYLEITTY